MSKGKDRYTIQEAAQIAISVLGDLPGRWIYPIVILKSVVRDGSILGAKHVAEVLSSRANSPGLDELVAWFSKIIAMKSVDCSAFADRFRAKGERRRKR